MHTVTKTIYERTFWLLNLPPLLPYNLLKNTIGIKNPIPELVVAPSMVIASAMLGTTKEMIQDNVITKKVHRKFCFGLNFT